MSKNSIYTEEERKEAHREAVRRNRKKHPIKARAHSLVQNYKQEDKKYNRGECTLTAQWIIDNIFTQPCVHCGKTGWDVIGCNRLDNDLPHTPDNVEPCCEKCNKNIGAKELGEKRSIPIDQIDIETGETIKIWDNARIAADELGINYSHIREACNGGGFDKRRNKWVNITQYKGFIWKYHPLN